MRRLIRPRILAGLIAGLVCFYAIVGFLLLPYLIEAFGIPAASERLKHPIIVRQVTFNPFTLALRIDGLEVREIDQTPILGFEEFLIDLRASSLFLSTVGFDEIRLVMPFVAAKVDREGSLNLQALIPPSDEAAPAAPADVPFKRKLSVEIELLEINKGILEFRDESKPRPVSIDIVPIDLVLRNFSTTPGSDNLYVVTAEIGSGEALTWEGDVSLGPFESDGKVQISGIKAQTLYQAVQDRFRFTVQQGEIELSASYHIDLRAQSPSVKVKDGRLAVRDLAIGERGFPEPLVKLAVFDIEGVQFDLEQHTLQIGAIRSTDAHVKTWINPGRALNLQLLATPVARGGHPPATAAQVETSQDASAIPWSVSVEEIELRNYGATFEDRTLARPGYADVEKLDVTVTGMRFPFTKPLLVELSMTLNKTGQVAVRGQVEVEPMTADLNVTLKEIGIRPFRAYLDRFVNMDVQDGAVDLAGTIQYAEDHPKRPLLRFQGNLAVNRLSIIDQTDFQQVIAWNSLAVDRLALDVEPTVVKIGEVVWREPVVEAVLETDGTLNLSRLLVSPSSDDTHAALKEGDGPNSTADRPPPTVTVDQVTLVNAGATFRDLSIEPAVKTRMAEFGGTIKGLSSKQIRKAKVDLAGLVDQSAPLKITGKINPLSEDAFTDLVITLGGMDVTMAGPYSGKYAGYGLSKGKLSLDLKYKLSKKLLEAENLVSIDQLRLGRKVESPDATSLPVPLLVALLQDRKSLIEVDLPIRGDLNDPDFKYGKVVLTTLLNLLGKIAASPFTLLGKLMPGGGSGEDLQFIGFQPGSAVLTADEAKKLDVLEQALDERAGLRLDIKGTADAVLDRAALRRRKLTDRLVRMKQREGGQASAEDALSPEDEQRFVAKLFAELKTQQAGTTGKASDQAESKPPTAEEMKERVLAEIPVTQAELEFLARQRGDTVREHLLKSGKLGNERVFMLDTSAAEPGHEKVRTQLALEAGS